MNLASVWKSRKAGKKKSAHKPKIRWQLLGLTDPNSVDNTSSIEVIRREVASLARHSLGEDTRLRSTAKASKASDGRKKSFSTSPHGKTDQAGNSI
ncbi:MAG: hypothetical protein E8D52_04335 [Nitrospira sp.]|nr:MAG: hypothetical protein E8D52_04335 [Nitrospira sp.]